MSLQKRALVVDDHEDTLVIVGYAFEHAGFAFQGARNRAEMRDALAKDAPDLIVLDVMLPGINGYQIIEELRAAEATRDIPVIVITARAETMYQRISADLGVAAHLTKPFHPETLVTRAQRIIEGPSARPDASYGAPLAR